MMRRIWLWVCVFAIFLTLPPVARAEDIEALSNFAPAKIVIGQADFTSNECNQPSGKPAANNLCAPEGAPSRRKGRLYIPDSNDNRVLGFNKVPAKNDASANFVLGQPDFSTTNSAVGQSSFSFPTCVTTAGKRLFVVDFGNSRVLIWNKLPTATDTPADVVVGQPDFSSSSPATTQAGLFLPEGCVAVARGKLFVSDRNNNRVLIWNSIPTSNGAPADVVVGQTDFTSSGFDTTRTSLNEPEGLWSDGKRLVVADGGNNRILIWDSIPTANGAPADLVVGQADFTSRDTPDPPDAQSLAFPFDVFSKGKRLFVADSANHRVLIYQPFPKANDPAASVVLGQSDFTHNLATTPSAQTLSFPSGVFFIGGKLFVTDFGNARVLIFNGK